MKIRRLPTLPGQENEAIVHFANDLKRSHLHAPRAFRNACIHSTAPANADASTPTVISAAMDLL